MFWFQFFNSEETMTAHRLIHHDQSNDTASMNNATTKSGTGSEKVYECDVCLKTFNKHSSWWKHKKCHTGERAYKCYICSKSFTQQANLHRVSSLELNLTSFRPNAFFHWSRLWNYRPLQETEWLNFFFNFDFAAYVRPFGREATCLQNLW